MLRIPDGINLASGKKWYTCCLCGGAYNEVDIPYKLGTATPIVGEILTGGTSGATAVVNNIKLVSGSWAGGDAAGTIRATSPSAFDFDTGHWGSEDETVTSATGSFTLDGYGHKKSYGRYYPEGEIVFEDGKYFCLAHYQARYSFKKKDEIDVNIDEGDRGE